MKRTLTGGGWNWLMNFTPRASLISSMSSTPSARSIKPKLSSCKARKRSPKTSSPSTQPSAGAGKGRRSLCRASRAHDRNKKGTVMKSREELHQELRQRILSLSGVTERQNAGIHEDAFFVGRTMFMHIHGHGHSIFDCRKMSRSTCLRKAKRGRTSGRLNKAMSPL